MVKNIVRELGLLLPVVCLLIVEACIARGNGLELIIEVTSQL